MVDLSKSLMCKKSFSSDFARPVPVSNEEGEEVVEEAWHEILRKEAEDGEETEMLVVNLPENGGDRRSPWPESEEIETLSDRTES